MRLRLKPILRLAAFGAACIPCGAQLLSGPMVGHATDTSALIWAFAGPGKTVEVEYGPAGGTALMKLAAPPRADRNHTSLVRLAGLRAATAYRYRVLVNGVAGHEEQFTTAPQAGKPARFTYFLASCMDYSLAAYQVAWDAVLAQKRDFNLMAGDNVYANSTDYGVLWKAHMAQRGIPGFAKIIASSPTYATWDDHDFGPNDSHGGTPGKENSLRAFTDLWANPSFGTGAAPGVFFSYRWANVQYLVMDTRYNRVDETAPLTIGKTQFGKPQLEWLYQQLRDSRSPFKVIVSSYDIMSPKFPEDIRQIAKFVADNRIYGVLFHSGDIHRNDFKQQDHKMGYPVSQITSSGVTRVINRPWVMIDVNTMLADPTLTARFFTQEKPDSTVTLKLSSLTPAGVGDLILNTPIGGETLQGGAPADIQWTRIGTAIDRVDIEYTLGTQWIPIAKAVPNTGSYRWSAPMTASASARVRVSGGSVPAVTVSPRAFTITGNTRVAVRARAYPNRVWRVFDIQGTRIGNLPIREGRKKALFLDPGE